MGLFPFWLIWGFVNLTWKGRPDGRNPSNEHFTQPSQVVKFRCLSLDFAIEVTLVESWRSLGKLLYMTKDGRKWLIAGLWSWFEPAKAYLGYVSSHLRRWCFANIVGRSVRSLKRATAAVKRREREQMV
ncbi:MAG: hypothetical protein ACTS4U_01170 [Candidatus Hodgkinia cicadicola]